MRYYGSIDYARSISRHFAGATLYEFYEAYGDVPDSEDKAFYEGKVRSAQFFARTVLPLVPARARVIANGDRSALEIPDTGL